VLHLQRHAPDDAEARKLVVDEPAIREALRDLDVIERQI
jgi:hypothetical protein